MNCPEDEVNNKINSEYAELCRKLNKIDLNDNLREEKKLSEADLHDLREETLTFHWKADVMLITVLTFE